MLAKKPFEIKVALLGSPQSGKTTVLNALCKNKYGQVSTSKRTRKSDASVNYFRITTSSSLSLPLETVEEPMLAESTLRGITQDNTTRFGNNDNNKNDNVNKNETENEIQEKWFEIELDEDVVDMRKDTRLVLVDIPGIGERGDDSKYTNYVDEHWSTFDCAVIVMDGKQGVSIDEEVFPLRLAQKNLKEKKDIPIIVLCNKVEDLDGDRQAELVEEARTAVEEVFQIDDTYSPSDSATSLLFISASAIYAFIHQTACSMSIDSFRNSLNRDLFEKIGRDQLGKRTWNRLSEEDKVKEVYDIVSAKETVYDDSNWASFLSALNRFIGGDDVQESLIEKQFQVSLWALQDPDFDFEEGSISQHFERIVSEARELYGNDATKNLPRGLITEFWKAYDRYALSVLQQIEALGPLRVELLEGPLNELQSFHELCKRICSEKIDSEWDESANIFIRLRSLVRRMIGLLLEQHDEHDGRTWCQPKIDANGSPSSSWASLSPLDWCRIWSSLLSLSYDPDFCELFGSEKAILEERYQGSQNLWSKYKSLEGDKKLCPCCGSFYPVPLDSDDEHCDTCKTMFLSPASQICIFCRARRVSEEGFCESQASQESNNCRQWRQLPKIDFKKATKIVYDVETGRLQPADLYHYRKIVQHEIPESFLNPFHMGHVAFKFLGFRKTVVLSDASILRHVLEHILSQESDSCILKAIQHGGYQSITAIEAMDKAAINGLEYEGFDVRAKKKLEQKDRATLSKFTKWAKHLKITKFGRLTAMDWIGLTSADFKQYCRTLEDDTEFTPLATDSAAAATPSPSSYASFSPAMSHSKTLGITQQDQLHGRTTRQMLVAFYQMYNSSKISDIDYLLAKYNGQEEILFTKLVKKYNADPSVFGLSEIPSDVMSHFAGTPTTTASSPFSEGINESQFSFAGFASSTVMGPKTSRNFDSNVFESPGFRNNIMNSGGTVGWQTTSPSWNAWAASPFGSSVRSPPFGTPSVGRSIQERDRGSPFGTAGQTSNPGSSSMFDFPPHSGASNASLTRAGLFQSPNISQAPVFGGDLDDTMQLFPGNFMRNISQHPSSTERIKFNPTTAHQSISAMEPYRNKGDYLFSKNH